MVNEILNIIEMSFYYVSYYFLQILNATGMTGILTGAIFIFMVVRFIIKPFVGGMSSTYSKKGFDYMKVENSKK